jgi:hypothetical protein
LARLAGRERRLLEGAQAQIPDALPQEVQDAIDHKAHLLSVQSFERIRAALAELARKRLEQGTPQISDMHLIQADDLWPLTSTMANLAFALSMVMDAPMDALHRLEARTGRRWWYKAGIGGAPAWPIAPGREWKRPLDAAFPVPARPAVADVV